MTDGPILKSGGISPSGDGGPTKPPPPKPTDSATSARTIAMGQSENLTILPYGWFARRLRELR